MLILAWFVVFLCFALLVCGVFGVRCWLILLSVGSIAS